MNEAKIQAVLFDVANVIIPWDPESLYRALIPDEERRRTFLSRVVTREWHVRHDMGIAFADNRQDLTAQFPDFAAEITAWGDRFNDMFGPPIEGTLAIIAALMRNGIPVYGLTNMPAEAWGFVRKAVPVLDQFQDIIVSAEVGLIKPDRAIYELALSRIGLPAGNVLFVDDTEVNVDAARHAGLHAHHFLNPEGLATALASTA